MIEFWIAATLGAVGLLLSGLFSGSETGFFRVPKMRLVLDALGGDLVARWLLWLTNHRAIFIATTLVGNNLANYVTSLAIVIGTRAVVDVRAVEFLAPLLFAPFLFVYGELLPKNLFLHAPNRLLRRVGPMFMVFVPLFFPMSALLWLLNKLLSWFVGESPEKVRLTLARRELRQALEEGHEAGILRPAQRQLAQGLFATARQPVSNYATPLADVVRASADMKKADVLGIARRARLANLPIEDPRAGGRLLGYVRVIDLGLDPSDELGPIHPLLEVPDTDTQIEALMRMQNAKQDVAQLVDSKGNTLGLLTAQRLRGPLLQSGDRDGRN